MSRDGWEAHQTKNHVSLEDGGCIKEHKVDLGRMLLDANMLSRRRVVAGRGTGGIKGSSKATRAVLLPENGLALVAYLLA